MVVEVQLTACAEACLICAAECEHHAAMNEHCRICVEACQPASRRVALCCMVQKLVNEILKHNEEEFGRDLGYAVLDRGFGRT